MYFGYASLSNFGFLAAGFWIVMAVGCGLGLVYPVGNSRGKRAALAWINACITLLVIGAVADTVWALVSGQWSAFMVQFGFSPLAEMMLLAALFIGSMWWLAVRFAAGLKG